MCGQAHWFQVAGDGWGGDAVWWWMLEPGVGLSEAVMCWLWCSGAFQAKAYENQSRGQPLQTDQSQWCRQSRWSWTNPNGSDDKEIEGLEQLELEEIYDAEQLE